MSNASKGIRYEGYGITVREANGWFYMTFEGSNSEWTLSPGQLYEMTEALSTMAQLHFAIGLKR